MFKSIQKVISMFRVTLNFIENPRLNCTCYCWVNRQSCFSLIGLCSVFYLHLRRSAFSDFNSRAPEIICFNDAILFSSHIFCSRFSVDWGVLLVNASVPMVGRKFVPQICFTNTLSVQSIVCAFALSLLNILTFC